MPSIGVIILELRLDDAHSLKDKRHYVKSLKDRLRGKFNVAVAEIDYGAWDGLSAKEVAERFPIQYARWTADPAWNPPNDGETAVALAQRVTRELEAIERTHHDGGNVLIVAHKATIRVAICALLGVDVGRFRYRFDCPVGSVTIIEFREHGPFAFAIADRSHLSVKLRALEGT